MIINLLLLSIAAAILAVESTISPLVHRIKAALYLNEENKYITLFSHFDTYPIVFGFNLTYILLPVVVLCIGLCNLYQIVRELVNCSFCLSFWLGIMILLLTSTETITFKQVLLHSTFPLVFVSIYLRIR